MEAIAERWDLDALAATPGGRLFIEDGEWDCAAEDATPAALDDLRWVLCALARAGALDGTDVLTGSADGDRIVLQYPHHPIFFRLGPAEYVLHVLAHEYSVVRRWPRAERAVAVAALVDALAAKGDKHLF